jgi:tetratricopeptide (TPR) repeat protein
VPATRCCLGRLAKTEEHARRALDLAPADDHLGRGGAAALLGLAGWASGDLEPAHQAYAAGRASLLEAGHHADALGCTIALADIRMAQGRLRDAMRTYDQALQLAAEQGTPALRGTADMHVGLSQLHRKRNDLPAATQLLSPRDFHGHGAWMTRAYAIALGAGTQVFTILPWVVVFGPIGAADELPRTLLMSAGWLINLAVAEYVIRRRGRAVGRRASGPDCSPASAPPALPS